MLSRISIAWVSLFRRSVRVQVSNRMPSNFARAGVLAGQRVRHTRVVQLRGHGLEVVGGRHDGGECSGVGRGQPVTWAVILCAAVSRRSSCVVGVKRAREGALVGRRAWTVQTQWFGGGVGPQAWKSCSKGRRRQWSPWKHYNHY
jgi:hypothetical protein